MASFRSRGPLPARRRSLTGAQRPAPLAARRTGYASLPLHGGRAPAWLFSRMILLSREILTHIVEEFGAREVLRRMSDPYWFQAFGCVLGFDWHSSGVTTTVCGAVKESLRETGPEWGLFAAGGKGAASKKSPSQIAAVCDRLGRDPDVLVHASRTAAKAALASVRRDIRKLARRERAETNKWFFKTGPGDYGEGDRFLGLTLPQLRALGPVLKNHLL